MDHSFINYLLNTYYRPNTLLGPRDKVYALLTFQLGERKRGKGGIINIQLNKQGN